MSKCLYCSAELSEGEQFCSACGKPVEAPEPQEAAEAPKKASKAEKAAKKSTAAKSEAPQGRQVDSIIMMVTSIALALFAVFFVVSLLFGNTGGSDAADLENNLTAWDGKVTTVGADSAGPESIVIQASGSTSTTTTPEASEESEEAEGSGETASGEPKVNTYLLVEDDCTWEEAYEYCAEFGGHLVTITSEEEYAAVCEVIEGCGLTYLWIGATCEEDGTWSEWITGEAWGYENWYPGEPTGTDADGTQENCLCLWNVNDSGWTFNDMRNNLIGAVSSASGDVGFVIEFE